MDVTIVRCYLRYRHEIATPLGPPVPILFREQGEEEELIVFLAR